MRLTVKTPKLEVIGEDAAVQVMTAASPKPVMDIEMEPETKNQSLATIKAAAKAIGAKPVDVEDVHNLSSAFPKEEIDESEPIKQEAMLLAGAMVALYEADPDAYAHAITTGTKKIAYESDLKRHDQRASGLNAEALAALAGAGESQHPSRLVYKLRDATCYERLRYWGRDVLSEKRLPRWLRRGPEDIATDVSYWYVARSCWHAIRVVDGVMRVSSRPDIPTDARPENVMGDDWKVIRGIPQIKRAARRGHMVRNDIDVLASALGYRLGVFGNLLLQELVMKILDQDSEMHQSSGRGKAAAAAYAKKPEGGIIKDVLQWAAALVFMGGLITALISIG